MARAPALHAGGHRFESVILHRENIDMLAARFPICEGEESKRKDFYDKPSGLALTRKAVKKIVS